MTGFLLQIQIGKKVTRLNDLLIDEPSPAMKISHNNTEFIAWGDPVLEGDLSQILNDDLTPGKLMGEVYGHYYYIWLDKLSGSITAGNSLFSILPVYYHQGKEVLTISDNVFTISKFLGINKINRRFILETCLFNYPLFNNSFYEGIDLLPANSYIRYSDQKISFDRHFETAGLFGKNPLSLKAALRFMPDIFLQSVSKYLPSGHYVSALTGGFDSRTLVSAGLMYKKDFSTYAFGIDRSKDLLLSRGLSQAAGLGFREIALDEAYVMQESLKTGKEFIINSSGTATFARAHYLYAARQLASETEHIITGNFGSEIFRAAHVVGSMFSNNLYALFNSDVPEKALPAIEQSDEYRCLNPASYKNEWAQFKEDVKNLQCYEPKYSVLTRNQRFYIFVMEEVFRKYFGAEMINQFRHVRNRTPYLDIDFLKEIFRTDLAGIHSGFFEHNPLKRYKGQILYSHIIRKAYPEFGKMMTDKGYRPDDLLTLAGKARVIKGYYHKKTGKSISAPDPNSVSLAWETNRHYWMRVPVPEEYFRLTGISGKMSENLLYRICSLSYCMNY